MCPFPEELSQGQGVKPFPDDRALGETGHRGGGGQGKKSDGRRGDRGWGRSVTSGSSRITAKNEKPTTHPSPRQSRKPRAQHAVGAVGLH